MTEIYNLRCDICGSCESDRFMMVGIEFVHNCRPAKPATVGGIPAERIIDSQRSRIYDPTEQPQHATFHVCANGTCNIQAIREIKQIFTDWHERKTHEQEARCDPETLGREDRGIR